MMGKLEEMGYGRQVLTILGIILQPVTEHIQLRL